jgi:hypothetical protein
MLTLSFFLLMVPFGTALLRRTPKMVRMRLSMSTSFGRTPDAQLSELDLEIRGLKFCLKNDGSVPSDDIGSIVRRNAGYDDVQSILTRREAERSTLMAENQSM